MSMMETYGIALDVDGVLVRDSNIIEEAVPALEILQQHQDKYLVVFVTNGGSVTEEEKAKQLSAKFGITVSAEQVILSHTPLRRLVSEYGDKSILVIGGDCCLEVAKSYGFQRTVCPSEYHRAHNSIYPSRSPLRPPLTNAVSANGVASTERELTIDTSNDLAAIFILGDSMDWGVDMQIMTDALLNNEAPGRPHIPIYACNADIVYTGRHPNPRYTQGAFVHAFKSLFEHYSDTPIHIEFCGKPFPIQYEYAEALFRQNAIAKGLSPPVECFGVGDNPKSDIRGANGAGNHWRSILVRTGVFQGSDNDRDDPADYVVQNILQAVHLISHLVNEKYKK